MASRCLTHPTSPCFFGGLTYLYSDMFCLKMMYPPLPPPELLVPIVWIIATINGCTCDVYCFNCGNSLLLARPVHGCGVLHLTRITVPNKLAAYVVFCDGSDGCWVGFTLRENAICTPGQMLELWWEYLRRTHLNTPTLTAACSITETVDIHSLKLLIKKPEQLCSQKLTKIDRIKN